MSTLKPTFSRKRTNAGTLRTPALFFEAHNSTPEPNSIQLDLVYRCFGEIYNPSTKDVSVLHGHDVSDGLTLIIRNTQGQFIPTLDHIVQIQNEFYNDVKFKIVSISPQDSSFIKLILTDEGN